MDILEQGRPSNSYGPQFDPNAPRRQPVAKGYERARAKLTPLSLPPSSSYPYDQPVPPSLEKADYYSSGSHDQHQHPRDIFTVNPYKPPKPWYRTTRGLVILLIVLLLLIGVTVGTVLGVKAINNGNADQDGAPASKSGSGVAPTSAQRGSNGESTKDSSGLPSYSSLSLVRLDPTTSASSQANLVITLASNPGFGASAIVQTAPVAPTPPRQTRPTPTPDPVCVRFPNLPACRRR